MGRGFESLQAYHLFNDLADRTTPLLRDCGDFCGHPACLLLSKHLLNVKPLKLLQGLLLVLGRGVDIASVVYTFAVLYSSAVSRLRPLFLSGRCFFVTVRRLKKYGRARGPVRPRDRPREVAFRCENASLTFGRTSAP